MKEMALKLSFEEEWELVSAGQEEKEKNIFRSKERVSYKSHTISLLHYMSIHFCNKYLHR